MKNTNGQSYALRLREAGRSDLLDWVGDRRQAFLDLAEEWRGRLADERAEAGGQRVAAAFSQVAEQRPLTPSGVNPALAEDIEFIETALRDRLKKLGIAEKVALQFGEDLDAFIGGQRIAVEGRFSPGLIEVSLKAQDAEWTLKSWARSHRNLPIEALYLFSKDTVQPFDAFA